MSSNLRPPVQSRPSQERSISLHRRTSSLSNTSNDSHNAAQLAVKRNAAAPSQAPQPLIPPRPSTASGIASSVNLNGLTNFSRPAPRASIDDENRNGSLHVTSPTNYGHPSRQYSQGFFEPSLPTTSAINMSASTIAAAAAMGHLSPTTPGSGEERKRSIPTTSSGNASPNTNNQQSSNSLSKQNISSQPSYNIRSDDGKTATAAATAASIAYPKSPFLESTMSNTTIDTSYNNVSVPSLMPVPDKEKTKSKMKLFSKPKAITITKDKDLDRRIPSLPSPISRRGLPFTSASTTSLNDSSTLSNSGSVYSMANMSTSTLVPANSTSSLTVDKEREKDIQRHRPHFLSRNKKSERNLQLSSASSNSQAVDPSAPSSIYSFAPQSPGIQSTISKSVTGFDLRHGGKGLREKWKEEKAAASMGLGSSQALRNDSDHRNESFGPASFDGGSSFFGMPSTMSTAYQTDNHPFASATAFTMLGSNMGLSGITPDDAWPLLKARLLNIFEGEEIRTPVEDFNLLVNVHIRRCAQKRSPHILVDDFKDFLVTGLSSLAQTLRSLPDGRLVPNLVEMWQMIYCDALPFIQAVFLPLDQEFRGHGSVMTSKEAAEFWSQIPSESNDNRPASSSTTIGINTKLAPQREDLDIRRMTLITFRDIVIMPRHETLLTIFSRLSLDSINTGPSEALTTRSRGTSNAMPPLAFPANLLDRPGTAGSSSSQRYGSILCQTAGSGFLENAVAHNNNMTNSPFTRSRATSNTSAGSFGATLPHVTMPQSPSHHATNSTTSFSSLDPLPTPPSLHTHTNQSSSSLSVDSGNTTHSRTRSAISVPDPNAAASLTNTTMLPAAVQMQIAQSSTQVTDTVARMLQCVSILAGCQTGDVGQGVVERLTGVLKHNWLGGGRKGRQRKGFVGMRVVGGEGMGISV